MRFLALMLTMAFAMPAAAEPGVRMFGGWIAGCSNENICTAIRPVPDAIDATPAERSALFVQIRHHPHRDAIPEITLIDAKNPAPIAVLRSSLAVIAIEYEKSDVGCKPQDNCPSRTRFYYARIDAKGSYCFNDEDAHTVLEGLRFGREVRITIGRKYRLPLDTAQLDSALAHFDRQQDLEHTPGALVLRPSNIMFDYRHPAAPKAGTVQLTAFSVNQLNNWRAEYPERMPDEIIHMEIDPKDGLALLVRAKSLDRDCGILERWGHVGGGNEFVLVERREMPVCSGIREKHWVQTYRANVISPP